MKKMSESTYKFNTGATVVSDIWREASREELLVLSYLMSGAVASGAELARACGISSARAKAALALWLEAGLISPTAVAAPKRQEPTVSYEFGERAETFGVDELGAQEVAKTIRDRQLVALYDDIAMLLSKAVLNTHEITLIASVFDQFPISKEYFLMLATHMIEKALEKGKKCTVRVIANKVASLINNGIDTVEELEIYLRDRDAELRAYGEYIRALGLFGRALSKYEKACFEAWLKTYGYGCELVTMAYDITIQQTSRYSIKYIHKILTAWHEAGVTTVAEAEAHNEKHRAELSEMARAAKGGRPKKTAEQPLYSNFDADDALAMALARSYADED